MRFEHAIWDFDGTLFDTYPIMAAAARRALAECGFDEPAGRIEALMKISMGHAVHIYREQYGIGDAFLQRYAELKAAAEDADVRPFPGAVALCRAIRDAGSYNYLFTHRGPSAVRFIERSGLANCFRECITSENQFARKPSPDGVLYLLRKYAIDPDRAIMIGDRDLDVLSGQSAGARGCYLQNGGGPSAVADISVAGLAELYPILGIDSK